MKQILISPYSRPLRNGVKEHPKDYPYFEEVALELKKHGFELIQVGCSSEKKLLNADRYEFDLHMRDLKVLLDESYTWVSGDNFFPHFANFYKKIGVAIFGRSDPKIFGYTSNINLLKSDSYLRDDQFWIWDDCLFESDVFVSAKLVVASVLSLGDTLDDT